MKRLQPVIWMKGTFLSPHHLQTQDRFIESTLQFQTEALSFAPWGFRHLKINQEALAAGSFAIASASGIFPDGLVFDMPDADPLPPPKALADCFEQDQETLDIYLAIPNYRERGVNVAPLQVKSKLNVDARYSAEVALLRDENTGLSEKPVQVARKNFRYLLEGESQQHSSVLRVARVRRSTAGMYSLEPRFSPPLLDLSASEFLVAILRRLVEILSAKSSQLAGSRRQKNLSLAEFGTSDIANFWLLYTINSQFPLMQHIFETRRGHPERLYAEMLSLAGCLTTFSTNIHPRDLPKYDHEDLAGCFGKLDETLRLLLETVIPSNFVSLQLKLTQPFIYAASLAEDRYLKDTKLYMAIRSDAPEADLIAKAPHLIQVCSASHIQHLVEHALPGVPLTHIPRPPSVIPVKMNYQYFSLNQSGAAWEAITRARNIAARVPGEFPNPQIELFILLPVS
jgi:type VI secretion system protein ImpJ